MSSKLREALEKLNAVDLSWLELPLDGDSSTIYNSNKKEITIPYWRVAELLNEVKEAQDMAKAALSAPPRNCDLFDTKDKAREAFQKLRGHRILADVSLLDDRDEIEALFDWLFTEANGDEK